HFAVDRLTERVNLFLDAGHDVEAAVVPHRRTVVLRDPDAAGSIFEDFVHLRTSRAWYGRRYTRAQPCHAAHPRAGPHTAFSIDEQRVHIVVMKCARRPGIEGRERHAVETDSAGFGREPQITVGTLRNRHDAVLGKAFVDRPAVQDVLTEGLVWIEAGHFRL